MVNELVGKSINDVALEGKGGSKHAVIGGGEITSRTMTSILNDLSIEKSRISLLKTDTDGFDWDAIRSSYSVISHCPYIYFECYYENNQQLISYKEMFNELIEMGYSHFSFFDNFGQLILSTDQLNIIIELLDYIKRQNIFRSSRTVFYFDVLAYSDNRKEECKLLIEEYNNG